MSTLKEVLASFDNPERKQFSYFDVSGEISRLPNDIVNTLEAQAELLAMEFVDNAGEKYWKTFLGPQSTWVRKDNGDEVLRPDRSFIKPEHIEYWKKRSNETNNPLMRMRYKGLVYDFNKYVTGIEPGFSDVKLPFLEAIIQVVEDEYIVHEIEGYFLIDTALQLASRWKKDSLFEKAQDVLWNHDHKYGKDESPGLWGRHFEIMIKYLDRYGKYENELLKENEERFDRAERKALEEDGKSDNYAHILGEEAELLCEYYNLKGNVERIRNYLDRELSILRKSFSKKGGMWSQSMLQIMQNKYRKYHLYKEANKLYVEIQDLGEKALNDMKGHKFSVPIDNIQIQTYIEDFLSGTPHEVFMKYLVRNIPNMEIERQRQKEEAEQSPLLDMISTITYDANGSPINNVGAGKNSENQKLMFGMCRRMQISAIFLRLEVEKMIEQGKLSLDIILEAFKDSPLIAEAQKGLFEKGMKAYFEGDYIIACHLLIPQFESSIRRLVSLCGGEVLQSDKEPKDGNRYISLDGLLDCDVAQEILKEDIQTYFKNLFTDQNGWNLRNLTSHGLLQTDAFNSTIADRIVHAFTLLSQLKFSKSV